MPNILVVKNLSVTLEGITVLQPTSFELEAGATMAIIGPNGAGKTILLRSLLSLQKYEGEIKWASDIRVGYVPQKIDADRHLPVNLRNLLDAKASTLDLSASDLKQVVDNVGLTGAMLATPIGHLSGGQFQRALIALALLGRPAVLVLDEPTASIDRPGEEQFFELVHRLQDTYGMTIILVSHDLSFVSRYATVVLCLSHAGPICFGPPDESLTPETISRLYESHRYLHHIHEH